MTEKLGRYEILEEIGRGGFAVVYRAYDSQLDRLVALKELKPMLLAGPGPVNDLRQEAKSIARLDHPNVVTIYDVCQVEQRQFIVMQLVNGSSLEELLARRGPLSWSEAVAIITALAAGLDYAHTRNILHRDLKPANILLDANHKPMLSDFGLAKLMGEAGASVTANGGVVGTPHYIAPEVWEGQGTTRQSEIYALGCILYEMLTGERLFSGETPPAVMMAHFRGLTLPKTWPEGVPPGVADVLATALAQKPANRYPTAGEMAKALDTLAKSEVTTPQLGPARSETRPIAPSILTTKLYPPPLRPEFVPRPRLVERLNAGLQRKLTLISAPAGFGKTTLVSDWLHQGKAATTWLSLDEGDNDPSRFLAYLVSALQMIAANIGEGVWGMLQSPQPPPIESILTVLLNEITTIPDRFVLVLDDYHMIDTKPLDDALTFLIEHLPPQMHLVITTREDPHLPLARLRVRSQLTELRAADLRFTPGEAATFLNQVMDLGLSAEEVTALESQTEGWIAGLQLAALSMQGRDDIAGFIKAFAGDNRYIVDYLVEEVLQRQPERVQSFLLQTSILDRLSGPLCAAVTGQEEGKARLEALERGNFFVVPLDDKRQWYRYHHLFADVLQTHLRAERPDQVSMLHRRASEWYERNGSPAEAIRHALAAGDFERAADLIERAVPAMRQSRQEATLLGWLQALPDELFQCRPVLSVHYAGTLLQSGQLDGVEARLRDAERWLDTTADIGERPEAPPAEACPAHRGPLAQPSRRMVVVDEAEFRGLPGWIAIYHAGIALVLGDVADTVKYARRALDLVPKDDFFQRGAVAALLGLAYWTSGDLEAGHRSYAEGMAHLQKAGYISDAIGGTIALADIRIAQGRLHKAMRTYEQALQLAMAQGEPVVRGTADMYVGLSELYRERDDLNAAMQHLLRSQELGEHTGFPQNPYRWRVAMARIQEAQGDLDGALDLLQEAERLYVSDFYPNVRPVSARKTRVWVAQGRLGEALGWVREQGLSVEDDLSYLREFKHITLARVLLARYKSDRADRSLLEAIGLLERLLQAAEEGGRMGSAIEILVLQALAHQALGDTPTALLLLQQALTVAEPEGYTRTFVDEGSSMAQLLREAAARGIMPNYTGKLLGAFKDEQHRSVGDSHLSASQPLIEPLSQRELEVLRLFKTELSGPEIAQELVIGLSTLRTHTKSIYSKLNVNNRRAAVNRAVELGLI